jgi:hypothetical protein
MKPIHNPKSLTIWTMAKREPMQFSWRGVLIAPAVVPTIVGIAAAILLGGGSLVLFLLSFVIASLVSYSVTIFVFLPCLYVLSRVRIVTGIMTSLLGLALGMTAYIPWTLIEWKSSGPDSGPPTESYLSFLLRWDFDPLTLVFLPAGLITASLYWWIGGRNRMVRPRP